jgi:cell wall-associated NlpC family hydrolase
LADPSIQAKQGEAQRVLAQIQGIDSSLDHAVDAYNLANLKLARIERDQKQNRVQLHVARTSLAHAQTALAARMVYIYTTGGEDSTLEVLLGSRSLDEMLSRFDTLSRVSDQDAQVIREVTRLKAEVQRREGELRRAHAEQADVVAARAAEKQRIESQLARRRALLSQIQGEIAHLKAAEQARQRALERQAQARLPIQQAAAAQTAAQTVLGVAASSPDGATIAPPQVHGGVVGIALGYLGTPYVYGGASPRGFDCSGFVMYVFAQLGISLPHNAAAQYGAGSPVSRSQLQPGDLVFFDGLGHVGIYIGSGQFVHAPHTGDVVKISSLSESWYSSTYVGARRI